MRAILFMMWVTLLLNGCKFEEVPCRPYSLKDSALLSAKAEAKAQARAKAGVEEGGMISDGIDKGIDLTMGETELESCLNFRCPPIPCESGDKDCLQKRKQCLADQLTLAQKGWVVSGLRAPVDATSVTLPHWLVMIAVIASLGLWRIKLKTWRSWGMVRKAWEYVWLFFAAYLYTLPIMFIGDWLVIPYLVAILGCEGWRYKAYIDEGKLAEEEPLPEKEPPPPCLQCGGGCAAFCSSTGLPRDQPVETEEPSPENDSDELKLI